ncbi:hypothetical protein XBJ1_1664 [Xenorhabdus bovienii SS-2004]|uniref:Uncharacterized protein n=1 Tax=Xenorhabdus bovienii (strain SS-2004) TaxID=406818 RepID=D3V0V8_XENBS|nr:hypothetical protein XBJ1_1664 [Xenorhabdus bovienii SS-2004]
MIQVQHRYTKLEILHVFNNLYIRLGWPDMLSPLNQLVMASWRGCLSSLRKTSSEKQYRILRCWFLN